MAGIVMLVNEFLPLPVGGAERQAQRLSEYLTGRGWEIVVITRAAAGLRQREVLNGIQVFRPPTFGPGKFKTISYVLGSLLELWRSRNRYQILHAHLAFGPAFAAVVAARLLGKRVIVKLGNSGEFGDIQVSKSTARGRLRLAVFRRWADVVIALDEAMRSEALAAGFNLERVRLMSNGIDAQAFLPQLPREAAKSNLGLSGKTVLLSVGRLAPQKSLPTLLHALAEALPACPGLHLLLVGDGPERAALETRVRDLGLQEHVTFTGSQADVRPFLNAADIFVLPSLVEGISNALLEAMAAGVACIATPVGGIPAVLQNGACGLLLPPSDVTAWKNGLTGLYHDTAECARLGAVARQRILAEYDFSVIGARYEALYTELMGSSANQ